MNKNIIWVIIITFSLILIAAVVLALIPKNGTLIIKSNQDNTKIEINKKNYTAPAQVSLRKGNYKITATKQGFIDYETSTIVDYKKETVVNIDMVSRDLIEPSLIDEKLLNLTEDNNHFVIELATDGINDLIVTLLATNNGGMTEESNRIKTEIYKQQLSQYKQEALDYIKNNGADPNNLKITWIPNETR